MRLSFIIDSDLLYRGVLKGSFDCILAYLAIFKCTVKQVCFQIELRYFGVLSYFELTECLSYLRILIKYP